MASWETITSGVFKPEEIDSASALYNKLKWYVQWDTDSRTVTSVNIRFRIQLATGMSGTTTPTNGAYLATFENGNNGTLYEIHEPNTTWGDRHMYFPSENGFTITKNHDSQVFSIPAFRIGDTRDTAYNTATDHMTFATTYADSPDKEYSIYNARFNQEAGYDENYEGWWTTPPTVSCSIVDNGDNTFTLSWTAKAGQRNPLKTKSFTWGYDANYEMYSQPSNSIVSGDTITSPPVSLSIVEASDLFRVVYIRVKATGTYGDPVSSSKSQTVGQYFAPSPPASVSLTITPSSPASPQEVMLSCYWSYATAVNSNSNVKGFIVKLLHKKATERDYQYEPNFYIDNIASSSGAVDLPGRVAPEVYYTNQLGYAAEDQVVLEVQAYSENGKGEKLLSSPERSLEVYIPGEIQISDVSITDNKDNTFNIGFTLIDGVDNPLSSGSSEEELLSKINFAWGFDDSDNRATVDIQNYTYEYSTFPVDEGTDKQRTRYWITVKGLINSSFASNNDYRAVYTSVNVAGQYYEGKFYGPQEGSIAQYIAPEATEIAWDKKASNKHQAVFSWSEATASNSVSPVEGYTLEFEYKGKNTSSYEVIDGLCCETYESDEEAYDVTIALESPGTIKLLVNADYLGQDPYLACITKEVLEALDFKARDSLLVRIYPYTRDGKGNTLYGDEAECEWTCKGGIVRIKTANGWKEGQVWVKTASGWKEATGVYAKTAEGWKESQ